MGEFRGVERPSCAQRGRRRIAGFQGELGEAEADRREGSEAARAPRAVGDVVSINVAVAAQLAPLVGVERFVRVGFERAEPRARAQERTFYFDDALGVNMFCEACKLLWLLVGTAQVSRA